MAHAAELPNFPEDNNPSPNTVKEGSQSQENAAPPSDLAAGPRIVPPSARTSPCSLGELPIDEFAVDEFPVDEFDGSIYETPLDPDATSLQSSPLDFLYEGLSVAVETCAPYFQAWAKTARTSGRKIKAFQEEKPFQLLGIIAGSAFALGMVFRFSRSRS